MAFRVAIVGRPNVGKSTLFNRLVGKRQALVDDMPGLTRDRREGEAILGDRVFVAIDTAGYEDNLDPLSHRVRQGLERAIRGADLILLVIDAVAGPTPLDEEFARLVRRQSRKALLVANKCESARAQTGLGEAHRLGFGEPIAISAEHAEGLADLCAALREAGVPEIDESAKDETLAARPIRLAVVGRPNVGKSTLVNQLLGEERQVTGPEPGITRDAIEIPWRAKGRDFVLIDTAGLRRKARVREAAERLSTQDTLKAIRAAQVVVLLIDGTQGLDKQDLQIARLATEEGRALVLAVNKWDALPDQAKALRAIRERIEDSLPQVKGLRAVPVSALYGRKLDKLIEVAIATHELWSRELPTPALNRWLEGVCERHPAPIVGGRRPRLRFMRQIATRPPTFALFGAKLVDLPDDYLRYLGNSLRDTFELPGIVLRFVARQTRNPYAAER
jgi:GTP-binding protein